MQIPMKYAYLRKKSDGKFKNLLLLKVYNNLTRNEPSALSMLITALQAELNLHITHKST